jgi:hypothetical protein
MASARGPSLLVLLASLAAAPAVGAQTPGLTLRWATGEDDPAEALVALDDDDDDDDGVPDLVQPRIDPRVDDEAVRVTVRGAATGAVRVEAEGGVRVLVEGVRMTRATVPVVQGVATVTLVGVTASAAAGDARLVVSAGEARRSVALTVVDGVFVRGDLNVVWPHRDAAAVSHRVTNDASLPRRAAWSDPSDDPDNLRAEVWDPGAREGARVTVESYATAASVGLSAGARRGVLGSLPMQRPTGEHPLRSGYVRLVADELDLRAPGVEGQTLRVGVRDRVKLRYRREGVAGEATHDLAVGRPGNEEGPRAARSMRWLVRVLRDRPAAEGGRPVVGDDDAGALRIARRQVALGNEIYAQCALVVGDPDRAEVSVIDPPPPALLAIGDDDGMRAAGGAVRLRVNGRPVGPVTVRAGWSPVETAMAVARALESEGFQARVTQNARTDFGHAGSADLVVRDGRGALVTLSPPASGPVSTDRLQRVQIGAVDLSDGVQEFNNLTSASGTLEERALLQLSMDDDPRSIELFIVNRFTGGTRIGEAFVEGDRGAIVNALFLDRVGILAEREAWTQSHEVGHILLNQPWHPDNMGPDRPWLLMDADASLGAATGPKRLTPEECARIRVESGTAAHPALLQRYAPARPAADARDYLSWPPEPTHPRGPAAAAVTAREPPRPRAALVPPSAASMGLRLGD